MRRLSAVVVILTVAIVGCAQPRAQQSAELETRGQEWLAAFNASDQDALMAFYAEDARLLPPNGEMLQGRQAIGDNFQALAHAGLTSTAESIEAMTSGDLGYQVGTYTLTAADGSQADRGKFIEIWRLIGGEWKITNETYNSDLEVGPAGKLTIGVHEVGDGSVWLAAWLNSDERRQQFASHGVASVRVFQQAENPNMTGVLLDVVDMDALNAFLQSDEGAGAAAADTVDLGKTILLHEVK